MSPINQAQASVPDHANTERFIATLRAYHEKRGTHLDPYPRVGTKNINLLKLFNAVVARGGYDVVSDEKLLWRKLGAEFDIGTNHAPTLAFQLKTVYYKYLAAYEISTIHGKEPPPKEILEDQTARGSGLLGRTMENYKPATRRETTALGNESDASGEDGTPVRDVNGGDEVSGSGGRATRGLRQAPPQRVLFQPETQTSRPHRNTSTPSHQPPSHHQQQHHHQPQHQVQHQQAPRGASTSYNPSSNMENLNPLVTNYEPRPQMPLTLRPVITPGNNPIEFARRQRALANQNGRGVNSFPRLMLPGSISPSTISASLFLLSGECTKYVTAGFDGPNIYVRCLCALKSGIPSEQDYALHHLVKISMERGDKYRFESFAGLAEALVEKLLEVSSLFYKVDWEISYMDNEIIPSTNVIDGLRSNSDILRKLSKLPKLPVDDNIQSADFADALLQVNEAALTMRNMVMLEENALYVSELYPLRAFLSIALNLPNLDSVIELKHYALDIAEQVTKYMSFDEADPLYISLLGQLQLPDRGAILTALRAISRISMNLEENNLLKGVPVAAVQKILDWVMLNDEDLSHACLDFLYQYTAVVENVDFLLANVQVEPLVSQLTRLLMHNAKTQEKDLPNGNGTRTPAPQELARLPLELLAQLNALAEPDRSSHWLRCLFEEDPYESLTQIALWQAYQARFTPPVTQNSAHPMLPAAEFIKNVSTTFGEKVSAQVQPGPVPKFIIKGIRMRSTPVDFHGEEYKKCLWGDSLSHSVCGEFFMSPEQMYNHILVSHVRAKQLEDGKFENTKDDASSTYVCQWNRCHRFAGGPATSMAQLASHVKMHLTPNPVGAGKESNGVAPPAKRYKPSYMKTPPRRTFKWRVTAFDERGDAAGVPLSAVLVLRNLARNIPKTEMEKNKLMEGGVSWVEQLFKPIEPHLFEVMAHNKALVRSSTLFSGISKLTMDRRLIWAICSARSRTLDFNRHLLDLWYYKISLGVEDSMEGVIGRSDNCKIDTSS
jgi:chromatin structure-remodeling complex subunit RSC9